MSEKDLLLETKALREKVETLKYALVEIQGDCAYGDVTAPQDRVAIIRGCYVKAVKALEAVR